MPKPRIWFNGNCWCLEVPLTTWWVGTFDEAVQRFEEHRNIHNCMIEYKQRMGCNQIVGAA